MDLPWVLETEQKRLIRIYTADVGGFVNDHYNVTCLFYLFLKPSDSDSELQSNNSPENVKHFCLASMEHFMKSM